MSAGRIKVLIVDDSAVVRESLAALLGAEPDIEVIGAAADPYEAVSMMRGQRPDVITLDVEMPRMDGLTFLSRVMAQHPIPVVVCSSLAQAGSRIAYQAFQFGATDVVAKPSCIAGEAFAEARILLCDAVRAASRCWPRRAALATTAVRCGPRRDGPAGLRPSRRIIAVGASTGGTEALPRFLCTLPATTAGVLVVQHMPAHFTALFAQHLDRVCAMETKEAVDGDAVLDGRILLAPGGKHMMIRRGAGGYFVEVRDGPLVSRHRPSVDVLFRSAAQHAGADAIGVILTGMGSDGARGMREMHDAGARTFAQDEASCVVYGMPRQAVEAGGVDHTVALDSMSDAVQRALTESRRSPKP